MRGKRKAVGGGLYKRVLHDGRTVYDFPYRTPATDGKLVMRWASGFQTKREARDSKAETHSRLRQGTYVEPSDETVAEYLSQWTEGLSLRLKPSTRSAYETHVRKYLVPAIGGVRFQRLAPAAVSSLLADLVASGLSPATARRVHATLHKALADAVREGKLHRNPGSFAHLPKHRKPEMKTWSAQELRAFLEAEKSDRDYPVFMLLATTGMRRGEALALRRQDLDLDTGRAAIRRSLIPVGGELVFTEPKNGRSRSVALDSVTMGALRAHLARRAEERLRWGPAYRIDLDLVFAREDGSPMDPGRLSHRFASLARSAGIPRIRLHDLRHTHATLALAAGVHPKVVQERLGHSNIAVTLDLYSHVIPAMEEEAAQQVANLVFGSSFS